MSSSAGGKHSAFPGRDPWPSLGRRAGCILHSSFLQAFTLLEVMIATALFGLVVAGTIEVYIMCNKLWHATSLSMQTARESSLALSRVIYGMETNSGLRSAAMVTLATNFNGAWNGTRYWENATSSPPSAADPSHALANAYGAGDGSWRMAVSNISGGAYYIDYNSNQRNMLFLPDPGAIINRLLICNYVSSARVTTNTSGTVSLQLTVEKRDGKFVSSNTVSTSVKMRNNP